MTALATTLCEVDGCDRPTYCLVELSVGNAMRVCETHGESAHRLGFATGFTHATMRKDLRSHEPPRNSGEGTAVNGPMPLAEKDDANEPA